MADDDLLTEGSRTYIEMLETLDSSTLHFPHQILHEIIRYGGTGRCLAGDDFNTQLELFQHEVHSIGYG